MSSYSYWSVELNGFNLNLNNFKNKYAFKYCQIGMKERISGIKTSGCNKMPKYYCTHLSSIMSLIYKWLGYVWRNCMKHVLQLRGSCKMQKREENCSRVTRTHFIGLRVTPSPLWFSCLSCAPILTHYLMYFSSFSYIKPLH